LAAHITEAVSSEKLIPPAEVMIHSDIKSILIVYTVLISEVVLRQIVAGRLWVESRDVRTSLIDASGIDR